MVGFVLLLICWWWQAWNFSDRFVAGTYVAKNTPIGSCNLIELKSDHSFKQQLWMGDRVALPAVGTWSRFGEAGVAFSKSFLGSNPDEVAKDNVYGMLDNTFGFHTLTVDPQTKPIKFKKAFFLRTCTW